MNGFSLIGRELDFGFWILDWIEFPEFWILELLIPHDVVPFFFFVLCFTLASIGVGGVYLHFQHVRLTLPLEVLEDLVVDIVYHIHETMRNVYYREATYQATSQAAYSMFYLKRVDKHPVYFI